MPMLFKTELRDAILDKRKRVTRRRWKKVPVKVGSIYQARTTRFGRPFAMLRVLSIEAERYPGSSAFHVDEGWPQTSQRLALEAQLEGFDSWGAFQRAWALMHGRETLHEPCWRVEFEMVTESREPALAGGTA